MKTLGLDIGTTTLSAVVVENTEILTSITRKNDSFLPTDFPWERIQSPDVIRKIAVQMIDELLELFPDIQCIGITGQMHGIVYLDQNGFPVSPLYIWQDGRGDLQFCNEESYATHLSRLTGYPLATGYGMVTHYYNLQNGLIPETAATFCTIHDYIAMLLAGNTTPVIDTGNAASLGVFHVEKGCFDLNALQKAGIDSRLVPKLAQSPCIGLYKDSIPVYVAIGDNQASFLGSTDGDLNSMLVNVGTGSQFSVYTENYMTCPGMETRPFPSGGYLLVGASLCGGRAYALLEQFFRESVQAMTGSTPESCYSAMDKLLSGQEKPTDLPTLIPLFQGTRQNPMLRGQITGLSTENFTPQHLIWAMLEGMVEELYGMYVSFLNAGGTPSRLIGSGNGLRKNMHMQKCFSEHFKLPLAMSNCLEEAATGAALFAKMNATQKA